MIIRVNYLQAVPAEFGIATGAMHLVTPFRFLDPSFTDFIWAFLGAVNHIHLVRNFRHFVEQRFVLI